MRWPCRIVLYGRAESSVFSTRASSAPATAVVHNKNSALFTKRTALFSPTTGIREGSLALRAVIFDYGMVLTGTPDPGAFEAILHITGLPVDRLSELYWADRHAYDEGKLTGLAFWQKLAGEAGLHLSPAAIAELNDWDARMWTTVNPAMLAWQEQVKQRGLRTAILSNMGDNVHARMEREFDWLSRFDVLVWSYQLRLAKPDPAIYGYALEKLGTAAVETLFIDDRQPNVDAALAMGMRGHLFTNVERLREDLIAQGLDAELPLPEPEPVSQ